MKPLEQTVPYHLEAEEAVLGALLIDPQALPRVSAMLTPAEFYLSRHQTLYTALLHLAAAPGGQVDFLLLTNYLERQGTLEQIGGAAWIADLINAVPSAINVEHYARLVHEAAVRRRLLAAAGQIAQLAYAEERPLESVLDAAQNAVLEVCHGVTHDEHLQSIQSVAQAAYRELEAAYRGARHALSTGFPDLDAILGGLRPAELLLVGARPGVGKTSWLGNVARYVAGQGKKVLIFSLEMTGTRIFYRLLAAETGVDLRRLEGGQLQAADWNTVADAAGVLGDLPVWLDDTPEITLPRLRAQALRLAQQQHGVDLLLVDYLQIARLGDLADPRLRLVEKRYQEVGAIGKGLKTLAKDLAVPVIAACQISRQAEDRAPTLRDLRESGDLEQIADVVLFIHRAAPAAGPLPATDFSVAKNRNGATGATTLLWQAARTRYVASVKNGGAP